MNPRAAAGAVRAFALVAVLALAFLAVPGPALAKDLGTGCGQAQATAVCREEGCVGGEWPCCHTLWAAGKDTHVILFCEV